MLPDAPKLMRAVSECSVVNSVRNDHPRRLGPGTAGEAAAA
jgi:hypothetical protein